MIRQEVGDGVFWIFEGDGERILVLYEGWRAYFSFGFSEVYLTRLETECNKPFMSATEFVKIRSRARLGAIEVRRIKNLR